MSWAAPRRRSPAQRQRPHQAARQDRKRLHL